MFNPHDPKTPRRKIGINKQGEIRLDGVVASPVNQGNQFILFLAVAVMR